MDKKLYLIFVNYNSGEQLQKGVEAVLKSPAVTGIVVVDNGSKDNSINFLKEKNFDEVIVYENKKNLGFYKALNLGIKKAFEVGAEAIMPLDFDLDFSFDFISNLSRIDADIVAPVLKSKFEGKWFYDYGGKVNWCVGGLGHLISPTPFKDVGLLVASRNRIGPYWFDFVSGGCTIIKKQVIEKIGFFDEDYFVYWGDADFSLHARDAGFKVVTDGNTIVHHKLEISRRSLNFRKLKISFFDNLTFIRKRVKWYLKPLAYLNIIFLSLKVVLVFLETLVDKKIVKKIFPLKT